MVDESPGSPVTATRPLAAPSPTTSNSVAAVGLVDHIVKAAEGDSDR